MMVSRYAAHEVRICCQSSMRTGTAVIIKAVLNERERNIEVES